MEQTTRSSSANVCLGSTADHPLSWGNRQQSVETGPSPRDTGDRVAPILFSNGSRGVGSVVSVPEASRLSEACAARPCSREAPAGRFSIPVGAERKVRTAVPVGATAILVLVAVVCACAASAEDSIKPGKWEFWVVGLKMREPRPGTLLPSQRWGPEGVINSVCLRETNLKTGHSHERRSLPALYGTLGKGSCDVDRTTDAATATGSMATDCEWSSGIRNHSEMVMHFHGDTLDGTAVNRSSLPNHPTTEGSFPIKGRYVGPCDSK